MSQPQPLLLRELRQQRRRVKLPVLLRGLPRQPPFFIRREQVRAVLHEPLARGVPPVRGRPQQHRHPLVALDLHHLELPFVHRVRAEDELRGVVFSDESAFDDEGESSFIGQLKGTHAIE